MILSPEVNDLAVGQISLSSLIEYPRETTKQ